MRTVGRTLAAAFSIVVLALAVPAAGVAGAATTTGGAVALADSAGCGKAPPSSGTKTITVGGVNRSYILDVPAGYQRTEPTPFVIGLHGLGSTGSQFRSYSGFGAAMGGEAIIAYPNATGSSRMWSTATDTPFIDAVLAQVQSQLCVETDEIFVGGHSMGGIFTNHLGCVRADVFRAIAPVAGGGPSADYECDGQLAVWIAHGNPDSIVPFAAGEATRDFWVAENHCSTRTRAVSRGVEYEGCDPGSEVRWVVHNQDHGWPSWLASEIWAFWSSRK